MIVKRERFGVKRRNIAESLSFVNPVYAPRSPFHVFRVTFHEGTK